MIVNHNTTQVANITITGNESITAPSNKKRILINLITAKKLPTTVGLAKQIKINTMDD